MKPKDFIYSVWIIPLIIIIILAIAGILLISLQQQKLETEYYKTQMIIFCEWTADLVSTYQDLPTQDFTPCSRWFIKDD